jgi:L-alanine-DL-glutamate epimerase-like enolase superfamily enzyme
VKIVSMSAYPLNIPFVQQFAHATKTRTSSDAVILRVELDNGMVGWGETLVRDYVTGETVAILLDGLKKVASKLTRIDFSLDWSGDTALTKLQPLTEALTVVDQLQRETNRSWNGLRCGIELAVLDALCRSNSKTIQDLLPAKCKEVLYSGVITGGDAEKSIRAARQMKQLGIKDFKLKVAAPEDLELVKSVRALIGMDATLRLDANSAFSLVDAISFCKAVEGQTIAAIEEPLSGPTPETLAQLQKTTTISIMPDESLVTEADARILIQQQSARMFNVRLAKCGGVAPSLKMIGTARNAGISFQIGALVGETGILSAVGRALAAYVPECKFVEGSYGRLLLQEDIVLESIRFGHGGRAPILKGPGLGVEVNPSIVDKFSDPAKTYVFTA